jgi:benzoate membrane transport protein
MLAGVLLTVCLGPARAAVTSPLAVAPVVLAWALLARWARPWAVPGALLVAGAVIAVDGGAVRGGLVPSLDLVRPALEAEALVGIALPLFLVTMASQNVPGMVVLASFGYRPPLRPLLLGTGLATAAAAPLGGHAVNLAAITAALAAGPDAGPDPSRRWIAAATAGAVSVLLGLSAGAVTALALAAPPGLIETVAGLALLGALAGSLTAAMAEEGKREAAVVTFAVSASGITAVGISAPFWGLVAGLALLGLKRFSPGSARR